MAQKRKSAGQAIQQPDLQLSVSEREQYPGHRVLAYTCRTRDQEHPLDCQRFSSPRLRADLADYLHEVFQEIDNPRSPRGIDGLAKWGVHLFEELFPLELRKALWASYSSFQSVQIVSQEGVIPWELLRLQEPGGGSGSGPYFAEAFALTRRFSPAPPETLRPPRISFSLQHVATVFSDDPSLPALKREREIVALLRQHGRKVAEIPSAKEAVETALAAGLHGGWHFAGHGAIAQRTADGWCLRLQDRQTLSALDIHGGVRHLGSTRPLVFLNACHSGRTGPALTSLAGLPVAFLRAGAGAVIGAHWTVADREAAFFAEEFYRRFLGGQELGEAFLQARLTLRNEFPNGHSWLAYTLFGHPHAVCEAPKPLRVAKVPKPGVSMPTPVGNPGTQRIQPPASRVAPGRAPVIPGPKAVEALGHLLPLPPLPSPNPAEEYVHSKDGSVLVHVPGGDFVLGVDSDQPFFGPSHSVRLSPFWIGKCLVTNLQYSRYLEDNQGRPTPQFWDDPAFNAPQQPVVGISWEEAHAYCQWAGLRLPTEAQWEAAARGHDERRYPWGNQSPSAKLANFAGQQRSTTQVGKYPDGAGPFGALDQAGNVWEWCLDPWDPRAYPHQGRNACDPVATGDPSVRVLRGGSWEGSATDLQVFFRQRGTANVRFRNQGFRTVWRPS